MFKSWPPVEKLGGNLFGIPFMTIGCPLVEQPWLPVEIENFRKKNKLVIWNGPLAAVASKEYRLKQFEKKFKIPVCFIIYLCNVPLYPETGIISKILYLSKTYRKTGMISETLDIIP